MAAPCPDSMIPSFLSIRRYVRETHDTFTIELEPEQGGFSFAPGQFNMLYLPGSGEVPISISGDPDDPSRIVHTIRAYGVVTSRIMDLKKGDGIGVRGPYGNEWPVESSRDMDILLVAGGIGMAPLRPVIYTILNARERYGRGVVL